MVKTLFQASTWNALALGNFDTVISVRELLRCADTGVGIGTALDGVITFENGAAYKTAPDGEVTVMRPEDSMAFAAAMVFDENAPEIALNGIDDLTSLKQMLAPFVQGNPNLFYMIKAGGVFKTMHIGKLILWSCTMLSTRAMPAMIIWTAAFFRNTAFTYPCPPRRSISYFGIRNCGQM